MYNIILAVCFWTIVLPIMVSCFVCFSIAPNSTFLASTVTFLLSCEGRGISGCRLSPPKITFYLIIFVIYVKILLPGLQVFMLSKAHEYSLWLCYLHIEVWWPDECMQYHRHTNRYADMYVDATAKSSNLPNFKTQPKHSLWDWKGLDTTSP